MAAAFEEADLRAGLNDGGQVLCAFIVARGEDAFVIYLRCNWIRGRGFRIIRTWRGSSGNHTPHESGAVPRRSVGRSGMGRLAVEYLARALETGTGAPPPEVIRLATVLRIRESTGLAAPGTF